MNGVIDLIIIKSIHFARKSEHKVIHQRMTNKYKYFPSIYIYIRK